MKKVQRDILFSIVLGFALTLCGTARADREHTKGFSFPSTAKTTLLQAVNEVERQGGQPVRASIHRKEGGPVYIVVSLNQGKKLETLIDPATGAVVSSKDKTAFRWFDCKNKDKTYAGFDHAKLTLVQAIAKVEELAGGKAFKATFVSKHSGIRFEISVAKNHVVYESVVNASTGDVVKLVQDKENAHDD